MKSHWIEAKATVLHQVFFWLKLRNIYWASNKQASPEVCFINFCLLDCARTESTQGSLMKELRKVFPEGRYTGTDERHFKVCGRLCSSAYEFQPLLSSVLLFTLSREDTDWLSKQQPQTFLIGVGKWDQTEIFGVAHQEEKGGRMWGWWPIPAARYRGALMLLGNLFFVFLFLKKTNIQP